MSATTPTAVVTGTSTGFGNLTARTLAREGFRVFATMRDVATRNAQPAAELRALGIDVVEMDVTAQASVDAAAKQILASAPRIDVLVNNAGQFFGGITEAFTPEAVERQYAANVIGPVRVTRAFVPAMRAAGSGHLVYVSSVVGRVTLPFIGHYAGTKWALEAYAEALSYELRPFGVDVTIVEPGAYATNIFNASVGHDDTAVADAYADGLKLYAAMGAAMGAAARDPQEVADAIVGAAKRSAGGRPLRIVVPAGATPVDALNAATEPLQHAMIGAFGLGAVLPNAAVEAV